MVTTMSSQTGQGRRRGRKGQDKKTATVSVTGRNRKPSSVMLSPLGIFLLVGSLLIGSSSVIMVAAQESNNDSTEGAANDNNLVPGDDKSDSKDDMLPFLTDNDVACMDSTTAFIQQDPELASASATFQDSHSLYLDEETGMEKFEYPLESANAMKATCELNNGHWVFVDSVDFTCTIKGMETMPLQVHDFGRCLAKTEDCQEIDNTNLLRAELSGLGFNCWEGASSPTASGVDSDVDVPGDVPGDDKTDSEDDSNVDVPADDKTDSEDDRLPFLTDNDVACMDSTTAFIQQDPGLASASATFQDSHSLYLDEETGMEKFEYPLESINAMKAACELNNGHWAFVDSVDFTCAFNGMETIPLQAHNFGRCLAKTEDCQEIDNTNLLRAELSGLGFNCWEGASSPTASGVDSDVNIPGDDKTDSEDACMDSTTAFIQQDPELASASATFQDSHSLYLDEETGMEKFVYPLESVNAMKAACELNNGHWAFVDSVDFTCTIKGMETIPLQAHNFGRCLAKTEDCQEIDNTSLLQTELSGLGYNCWEGASSKPASGVDTGNSEGGESDGNAEENVGQENNDQDTDAFLDQNDGDSLEDSMSNIFEGLDLSESDQKCLSDKFAFDMQHPELQQATEELAQSMEVDSSEIKSMKIGFSYEIAQNFKSICLDSTIGGYFSFFQGQEFLCDMMSVEMEVIMLNIADCLPDTPECRDMDPFLLMTELWSDMGLTCREKTKADDISSSTSDNDDNKEPHPDDTLFKELRLTHTEAKCMSSSSDFIDNSSVLSNATFVYEKSAQMTDPTKIGFSKASASEMEQVCAEQGGLWSFIESEDVTCAIEGRNSCINVYNFGNCISNNDDCQSTDPMVFVEAFFLEVMHFSCRAKCDQLKDTSWHPPSSAPHQSSQDSHPYSQSSNNNNLSAPQSTDSSETKPSSYTTAAVLLSALAAIGFIAFYRRRAGRRSKRAYETTEITDLGFRTIT